MSKAEAQIGVAKFGMLGLGVMGQNLALNIERNGYRIALPTGQRLMKPYPQPAAS